MQNPIETTLPDDTTALVEAIDRLETLIGEQDIISVQTAKALRLAIQVMTAKASEGWEGLFAQMRAGNTEAIEDAISLIRTHAIEEGHPLALD